MFIQALRGNYPSVVSKNFEEPCLYLNALAIATDAWVLQNRRLVDDADETFTTTANYCRDSRWVISANFNDFDIRPRISGQLTCSSYRTSLYTSGTSPRRGVS